MKSYFKVLFTLGALVWAGSSSALQNAQYEVLTSSRAMAARDQLSNLNVSTEYTVSAEMYSMPQMNRMIENSELFKVVRDQDKCQFTRDIEDRARIVGIPTFQFAWGDMLLAGACVRQDLELGFNYVKKAADGGYAAAMERLAFYYENGYYVGKDRLKAERYMHTAAILGSKTGRIGWADMLLRGYGSPSMYEEAYSWLYHSTFTDVYTRTKQMYLQSELEKLMPAHVVARNAAHELE